MTVNAPTAAMFVSSIGFFVDPMAQYSIADVGSLRRDSFNRKLATAIAIVFFQRKVDP